MNVLLGIIRRIVLDDPVHCRDVQSTRCHVGTEQYARLGIDELEEDRGASLLLLLSVDTHHRNVDIIEQLCVELHRVAA